jgi:hypothetical protein
VNDPGSSHAMISGRVVSFSPRPSLHGDGDRGRWGDWGVAWPSERNVGNDEDEIARRIMDYEARSPPLSLSRPPASPRSPSEVAMLM